MSEVALVTIGRVVKAHGIRGEVVVQPLSDVEDRFAAGVEVVLGDTATTIETSRPHQGRLLLRFAGVTDRNAAERLRGRDLRAEPLDLAEHEHLFVHELLGAEVVGERSEPLGAVVAWIELPESAGYDLLEVEREDGTSWWLPAVDDYVEVEELEPGDADAPGTEDGRGPALRLHLVAPPEGLVEGEPDVADRAEEAPADDDAP